MSIYKIKRIFLSSITFETEAKERTQNETGYANYGGSLLEVYN